MRRLVPALVAALSLTLALTACDPGGRTTTAAGNGWKYYGIAGGTGDGGTADGDIADGISFDEALADGTTVEWTDSMFADADFTVDSPDDGNGRWSYRQVSTGCRVTFWQTTAEGIDPGGSEADRSDAALASFLGEDLATIQEYAFDSSVAIAFTDAATFDARAVVGGGDTEDWVTAARTFNVPDVALAVDVTCDPGTESEDVLASLMPDFVAARIS